MISFKRLIDKFLQGYHPGPRTDKVRGGRPTDACCSYANAMYMGLISKSTRSAAIIDNPQDILIECLKDVDNSKRGSKGWKVR